jgi:hypothetical protein
MDAHGMAQRTQREAGIQEDQEPLTASVKPIAGNAVLGDAARVDAVRRHCDRAPQGRLGLKSDRERDARFPR